MLSHPNIGNPLLLGAFVVIVYRWAALFPRGITTLQTLPTPPQKHYANLVGSPSSWELPSTRHTILNHTFLSLSGTHPSSPALPVIR
ncbi:hypothetical protein GGR56DRAFT_651466 [Xylariaceae sp. FL0804]|nr:hypothetical protein GGR56DRAFT_651466 [Xylariaceae sp. FL0804]